MVSQLCVAVKAPCRQNPATVSYVADMSATCWRHLQLRASGFSLSHLASTNRCILEVLLELLLLRGSVVGSGIEHEGNFRGGKFLVGHGQGDGE